MGHTFIAFLFHVKIESICIYPLGGISKFDMPLNISPLKEFLILIGGPIFQFFAYFLLLVLLPDKKVVIAYYHFGILLFNLLPIYPLDGGKLITLFLEWKMPYKSSLKISILISYLILFGIFINIKKLLLNKIVFLIFVLTLITKESKKINYTYNKFLLERYLKEFYFPKEKKIEKETSFYRNRKHWIKQENKYVSEKEFLEKKYKKIF